MMFDYGCEMEIPIQLREFVEKYLNERKGIHGKYSSVSVQQENNSTTFFDHSKRKFSKRDVIGYFVGDFGNNMSFSLISSFMFIFFTQFVGIRLVDYSINIRIKKIFDGINDPVVGPLIVINLKKEINLNPGSNMVVSFLRLPVH